MKKTYLKVSLGFLALALMGCGETGGGPSTVDISGSIDTAIVNYNGTPHQRVYYNFADQKKTVVAYDAWDLAIQVDSAKVIANCGIYGMGVRLYATDSTNIDADFSAYKDSVNHIIDDKNNPLLTAYSDAGVASDKVYLIKDAKENLFKIKFAEIVPGKTWSMLLANGLQSKAVLVDGVITSNQQELYFDLSADSIDVSALIPQSANWDIVFVRALEFSMGPAGWGARSAILLNTQAGIMAGEASTKPFDSTNIEVNSVDLSSKIDAIGFDWYVSDYDPTTHISTVSVPNKTYYIKDESGTYFKMQLLTFYGPKNESYYSVFRQGVVPMILE